MAIRDCPRAEDWGSSEVIASSYNAWEALRLARAGHAGAELCGLLTAESAQIWPYSGYALSGCLRYSQQDPQAIDSRENPGVFGRALGLDSKQTRC